MDIFDRTKCNLENARRKQPRETNPRYSLVGYENGYPVFKAFPGGIIGNGAAEILTNGSIESGPIKTLPGGVVNAIGMPRPKQRVIADPPISLAFGKVQIFFVRETATDYEYYVTGYKKTPSSERIATISKSSYTFSYRSSQFVFDWYHLIHNLGGNSYVVSFLGNPSGDPLKTLFRYKTSLEIINYPAEAQDPGNNGFYQLVGGGYARSRITEFIPKAFITDSPFAGSFIFENSPGGSEAAIFWSPRLPAVISTPTSSLAAAIICVSDTGALTLRDDDLLGPGDFYSMWENPQGTVADIEQSATAGGLQLVARRITANRSNIVGTEVYTIDASTGISFSDTEITVKKTSLPGITTESFQEPIYMPNTFTDGEVRFLCASYHPG